MKPNCLFFCLIYQTEDKVSSVHLHEGLQVKQDTVPIIFNLGAVRGECSGSRSSRFNSSETIPRILEKETGSAKVRAFHLWRREKSLVSVWKTIHLNLYFCRSYLIMVRNFC
jgi:hypothetical protein